MTRGPSPTRKGFDLPPLCPITPRTWAHHALFLPSQAPPSSPVPPPTFPRPVAHDPLVLPRRRPKLGGGEPAGGPGPQISRKRDVPPPEPCRRPADVDGGPLGDGGGAQTRARRRRRLGLPLGGELLRMGRGQALLGGKEGREGPVGWKGGKKKEGEWASGGGGGVGRGGRVKSLCGRKAH